MTAEELKAQAKSIQVILGVSYFENRVTVFRPTCEPITVSAVMTDEKGRDLALASETGLWEPTEGLSLTRPESRRKI
jgi:hypothetical protein